MKQSWIDDGLLHGAVIAKAVDVTRFSLDDVTRSQLDARLLVARETHDDVVVELHFDPDRRAIYSVALRWPQEHEQDGVETQLKRGREVSAALRAQLGEGELRQRNQKKNAERSWEHEGRRTVFSFTQHSNHAGWYADLRVTSSSLASVDEFLSR